MTRKEAIRQTHLENTLIGLGIHADDVPVLRRISSTLNSWATHECNGTIQRDGDQGDGKPFWYSSVTGRKIGPAPDREAGALVRLQTIMAQYPTLAAYVQGDPRGCSLYILRPGDVPEGKDADGYYSRGIAVY